jgi:capsular polysaccharide biosynthesis protein
MMRGASILIGATGTGLVNVLLMESGKTVIELKVEHLLVGNQGTMPDYADFSYARDHTYIGLDVSDKQADTAIEKLKGLFKFFSLE